MGFSDRFELDVTLHPFLQSAIRYREAAGYPGRIFFAVEPPAARPTATLPPAAERLATLHALLDARACPRARTPFEAYCLVLQLVVAIDNRYLGPLNPHADNTGRLGLPEVAGAFDVAGAPGAMAMPFRDQLLVLDPAGGIDFRPPGSASANARGRLRTMRRYVDAAARSAPPAPGTSKRERMARFLALLADAPRAANDLAALATVRRLLGGLETSYLGPAGSMEGERLNAPLPFLLHTAPPFPDAGLMFTIAHAVAYFTDGTVEIYECEASKSGPRTGPVHFGRRVLKVAGR